MNQTEEVLELWMENQINRLDTKYLTDLITTEEYEAKMAELNRMAEQIYLSVFLPQFS